MKRINLRSLLCLTLCVLLLQGYAAAAPAGETTAVFAPDFTQWGVQGNNGWYYMYKGTDEVCRNLNYYDAQAPIAWQQDAFAFDPAAMGEMLFINRNSFFTGERGSFPVYCFVAPYTGKAVLEFETHGPSGVGLRVFHGRTPVKVDGSGEIAFTTAGYTKHSVELTLKQGERIYLEGFTTSSNREGWLRNYQITYRGIEPGSEADPGLYAPDLDYGWGAQNNRGWYYLYQDLATLRYTELPFLSAGKAGENFTDCFSADRVFPYCFIKRDVLHPAINANAVKAFCAPKSGEVRFSVRVRRSAEEVPGSPSLLTVYRGNEVLRATAPIRFHADDGWDAFELKTQLFAGEWVYFVLSCDGSNLNGEVQMSEMAEYLTESEQTLPAELAAPAYEGFQIRDCDGEGKDLRFAFSVPNFSLTAGLIRAKPYSIPSRGTLKLSLFAVSFLSSISTGISVIPPG